MNIANYTVQGEMLERRRVRGNWNVSPLREGKILLGILKQHGLAGKGLVEAFEKWAPRIVGASRGDMNKVYKEQTGREMSDYILVQQGDKAVRYKQLPPEAEGLRLALAQSMGSQSSERATATTGLGAVSAEQHGTIRSAGNTVADKITTLVRSYPDLSDARPSNALLSTNELAGLTGFAPKTIRRWASRRLLNYIRVGNQFRFRPAAVELFLMQREVRK
ncbi:MAG TPA: helix-turn-helix domain-containing protein [Candidatus Acidoferrum sp.]